MLFSDFDAISSKNIFSGEDKKKFDTLFSYIDVTNTKDSKVLAEEIQKSWKEKEISFQNDKMHMISVFMTMDDGKNKVQEFVGHVGFWYRTATNISLLKSWPLSFPIRWMNFPISKRSMTI